jgi:lipopolysaccharide transport system permease protein
MSKDMSPIKTGAIDPASRQVVFDTGEGGQAWHAARDLIGGVANYDLWSMLGWREIKQRYRRSTLGPFWVTISMAFMVLGLGLVYSLLFNMELATYLPFVCLGLILWEFISKSILDGSMTFLLLEGVIKQIRLPLTTHVVTVIWKNVLVLAHNAVILVVVFLVFQVKPTWNILLFVPGLILVTLNLVWVALLLATVCTRFRDVPLIVQTAVQMLFFVTPVFWLPSLMPARTILVHGNPFHHMLEVTRAPLLGQTPTAENWIFLIVMLVLGWAAAFLVFTKFRRRIPYWL